MNKVFYKAATIIFALTLIFSRASAEGIWRLDGSAAYELPRNFRVMEDLKISASGQPSLTGLAMLYNEIRRNYYFEGNFYIVDLREESHGFAIRNGWEGFPVSYYTEKNLANFFKPRNQIEEIEIELLEDMIDRNFDFLPLGNEDKKLFKPINVTVENVMTEHQKADELGFIYVRFPVTDMFFPTPDIVDQFINFVGSLRERDWVHFHCQAGHGRTTTFTVMYEILKNPEKSLGDICREQAAKGGSDLLSRRVDNGNHDYYVEAHNSRAENLIKFFFYVRGVQREEIGLQWSEYVRQNK